MNRLQWLWLIGCLTAAAPQLAAQGVGAASGNASQATPSQATEWMPPAGRPLAKQTPHPAVVRVTAPGKGSVSYGSGCLVAVNDRHGVVITNWHVINEATGIVTVEFPDGFESAATIQKIDRDWDLAALVIWKPSVAPASLARQAPRPGERLTIAGYGSGKYRAASGACTQYVAPGLKFPYEMVEVSVAARQGDSGGPIFNNQGELAGVLFGAGDGRTSGSYCGRVQWFLDSVLGPRSSPGGGALIAGAGSIGRPAENSPPFAPGNSPAYAANNGAIATAGARPAPNRPARIGQPIRTLGELTASLQRAPLEPISPGALDSDYRSPAIADRTPLATSEMKMASTETDRTLLDASVWRPIAIADSPREDLASAQLTDLNGARANSNRSATESLAADSLATDSLTTGRAWIEPLTATLAGSEPGSVIARDPRQGESDMTRWEQIKAFLAVVGVAGFLLWLVRALTTWHGPSTTAKADQRKPGGRKAA